MYYLLHYKYVDNIISKREPFRDKHLGILKSMQDNGECILAGAVGEPIFGATFVFKVNSEDDVLLFVDSDPYVANNLVTEFTIQPWTVAVGSAHQTD